MIGILGKKLGMTTYFTPEGDVISCTVVEAGPCVVTQIKTAEKDGYTAVQVGYGKKKEKRVKNPQKSVYKKLKIDAPSIVKEIRDYPVGDLKEGDEILTTTHEHGGGEIGLEYLAATQGAVIKKLQMPVPALAKETVIEAVVGNITAKTKVVMLSHVNTLTGLKMPFEEISKITKPKGIVLIADGAQAPGLISVDVKSMGVDAYAASGHKWMLGPKETGFVCWSKELQQKINPVFTSSGFESYSASSGTRNVALISGLGVAIDWLNLIGKEKIENRCLEIRSYCLSRLKELKGIVIISPQADSLSTGIVSFTLKEGEYRKVAAELAKEDIIVKVLPKYNGIRISCHMFVSKPDIDRFIQSFSGLI